MPSSAVTSTVSALAPTAKEMAALAVPEFTAARLDPEPAFSVAAASAAVAVRRTCVVPFGTVAAYAVVPAANVPRPSADQPPSPFASAVSAASFAFDDSTRSSRVAVTVYVFTVPFSAVTSTLSAFAPTAREIAAPAVPEFTAARLDPEPAFSVAVASAAVAVRRTCVVS